MCLHIAFLNYTYWKNELKKYDDNNIVGMVWLHTLLCALCEMSIYLFQFDKKNCILYFHSTWPSTVKTILICSEKFMNGSCCVIKRKWSASPPARAHLPPAQHFNNAAVLVYLRLLSYFPCCLCIIVFMLQNIAIGIPSNSSICFINWT